MITPTVGRIVLFSDDEEYDKCAAIVCHVHSDRMVNLAVFNSSGYHEGKTSVPLVQPEDERPTGMYCEWMPYQVKKETGSESGEKAAGTQAI